MLLTLILSGSLSEFCFPTPPHKVCGYIGLSALRHESWMFQNGRLKAPHLLNVYCYNQRLGQNFVGSTEVG